MIEIFFYSKYCTICLIINRPFQCTQLNNPLGYGEDKPCPGKPITEWQCEVATTKLAIQTNQHYLANHKLTGQAAYLENPTISLGRKKLQHRFA
jgi:hypothetical protein